jgi:hypothetical protein
MLIVATVSKVRYLLGLSGDFGTDQDGREWKSLDSFDEDFGTPNAASVGPKWRVDGSAGRLSRRSATGMPMWIGRATEYEGEKPSPQG